jgi:thiol-disulfide isomerase/thioredoxin
MKNLTFISLLTLLMTCTSITTYAGGIDFNHEITFDQALEKAKKEGKLIFMDCYTSWCGPCKRLAATVFTDSSVGEYFNDNYINVKFDMEKGEGTSIATRYQITAYPTLLWLDGNGSIKNKVVGGLDVAGLIAAGKKAADPIPGILSAMDKKYGDGNREMAFMEEYLKNYKLAGRDCAPILDEYIKQANAQKWPKEATIPTIYQHTYRYPSPGIEALMSDRSAYVSKYGAKAYGDKMSNIATAALADAKRKSNEKMLGNALKIAKSAGGPNVKQQVAKMEMDYYFNTASANVYDKYVTDYIKKYAPTDTKLLNDVAWQYYINTNDEKYLKKAMQWAYKAVNIQNNCTNNTTYAYLQYKLGNYPEATKNCDYAIIKAKEENIKPVSALALKEAIKKEMETTK